MLLRKEASCSSVSFSSDRGLTGQCIPIPLHFWPQRWLVQPWVQVTAAWPDQVPQRARRCNQMRARMGHG